MASAAASLTSAFSSLSFSSHISSSKALSLSLPIPLRSPPPNASTRRRTSLPIRAIVASSPAVEEVSERRALEKYVKSRLPGGIAAQNILATGKKKCAIARVVLQEGNGEIFINYRHATEYLQKNPFWLHQVKRPLLAFGYETKYDIFVKAHGGGLSGQAEAIRLGISRALLKISEEHRPKLRKQGLVTRDSRIVERKKVGRHKARRGHQYSKR